MAKDKEKNKSGLPDDIIRGVQDKVLDLYPVLEKEFGGMDREKFIRMGKKVEKMIGEHGKELRFIDYLYLDRILYWRQQLRSTQVPDRERHQLEGREQALRRWALGFPGKVVLKAEEMKKKIEEEEEREKKKQGNYHKDKSAAPVK